MNIGRLLLPTLALALLCSCAAAQRPDPTVFSAPTGTVCSSAPATEAPPAAEPDETDPPCPATTIGTELPSGPAAATDPTLPAMTEYVPREFTEADYNIYLIGRGKPTAGKINVEFSPDNRNGGQQDPNIRIWDSWMITDRTEMTAICTRILADPLYDTDLYGRTLDSMLTEWKAHNDIHALYPNERTRHVDFNRADEGVSYNDFWKRAMDASDLS